MRVDLPLHSIHNAVNTEILPVILAMACFVTTSRMPEILPLKTSGEVRNSLYVGQFVRDPIRRNADGINGSQQN
jgi:hypothetical protein